MHASLPRVYEWEFNVGMGIIGNDPQISPITPIGKFSTRKSRMGEFSEYYPAW